jgi:hypothetical protein
MIYMIKNQCVDCVLRALANGTPIPNRPCPHPGPRCATCHRAVLKARRRARHDATVALTYGLPRGAYARLHAAQGGRCSICRLATGASKRLAVDHDHVTGEVRGLLCGPCNTMLGRYRDSPEILRRAIAYLEAPPAREVLATLDPP